MNRAEEALAIVRERGEIRSSALAELLDCTPANVHELLLPFVQRNDLVSCDVQAGGEHLKDYRVSVAGGGEMKEFRPYRRDPHKKTPPTPLPPERQQPKENVQMSVSDKCEAAFRKHGPMTTRELREHVKGAHVSTIVSQCTKTGRFAVLGGGPKSRIYGLPDQKAPTAALNADKPPRHIHQTKKAAGGGWARA